MSKRSTSAAFKKSNVDVKWDAELFLVAQIAACVSFLSFLYYLRQGDLLLFGDVFGHINIARRIFDSRTPGLLQLGTVWLPLPHLLILPFIINNWMWMTGIGGSIPSLFSFILAVTGVFRLVRNTLSKSEPADPSARRAAWIAAAIFAANPNLIYMQAIAMNEALYLALFIWSIVYFAEFLRSYKVDSLQRGTSRSLLKCGLCLFVACFTRYDGWFLGATISLIVFVLGLRTWKASPWLRQTIVKFLLIVSAAPALWLGYNAVFYQNPIEFANGPYSAKGLSRKDAAEGTAPYPGANNLAIATIFFVKASELNLAEGNWGRFWLICFAVGVLLVFKLPSRSWALWLLLLPIPFYALSIAYSGVPIYLPVWWPHTYYNARYGLELLPAVAVFAAVVAHEIYNRLENSKARTYVGPAILALVALSYAGVWRAQPICLREALANSRSRTSIEGALANNIRKLPPNASILMYLGDHVGALERAGIPLKQTINEGNAWGWKKPANVPGLWDAALANPALLVDYVIAVDGDPVALRVNRQQLTAMLVIHVAGEPPATLYSTPRARLNPK